MFIVGRGSSNTYRTNAFYVKNNGDAYLAKDLTVSSTVYPYAVSAADTITAGGNIDGYSFTINGSKLLKVSNTVKDNVSIAKATTGSGSFTVSSISGYTPVGIVGFDLSNASSSGTGVGNVVPLQWQLSGSTVNWQIRNNHASNAAKIQIQVFILYAKTGLI